MHGDILTTGCKRKQTKFGVKYRKINYITGRINIMKKELQKLEGSHDDIYLEAIRENSKNYRPDGIH